MEAWYGEYPESSKTDLRSRFREPGAGQHYGAWWELYIYTLYRRLGYSVTTHPELPNTSRQPDFLVSRGQASAYIECAVSFAVTGSGKRSSGQQAWIFEATNQAKNPDFFVDLEIRRSGTERPKASEIVRPLENWLSSLDANSVSTEIASGKGVPELVLDIRGWQLEYSAWPVEPEHRGEKGRILGIYPVSEAFINNETQRVRSIVRRKGGRYGLPDKPLVLAILNTSGFIEETEVAEALFGSIAVEYYQGDPQSVRWVRRRDGYWRQGPPIRGSRVSAVLHGENIYPWRVCTAVPKLWINPWAEMPLGAQLPFEARTARDTGEVFPAAEASVSGPALFDLPPDWPGF
ncbi:hypothetical protein [Mycobacterium sp. URHB0021]